MFDALSSDLVLVSFCAWGAAALIAARDMHLVLALLVAAVRVSVPLVYFACYYDGMWNVGDDLVYAAHGSELIGAGYNPWSVITTADGWRTLLSLSQGHHVLYGWWNLLTMSVFGEHYYAPVFCNVVLTFVGGALLVRTARLLGFGSGYCRGLQLFWLLHWDLIAWSSLLNIKDVLVQTLTIGLFYCLVGYITQRKTSFLACLVCVAGAFWWIRFYVPVVVLTAVMIWMLTQWQDRRRYLFIPVGMLAYYFALPMIVGVRDYWQFQAILYGMVRFALTPVPWQIHEVYGYLQIPTVMHWLFSLPAALGAVYLWNQSSYARLFLIYLGCLVALYAVTEELLGPRQRFQVAFLFAWAQFHFVWRTRPERAPLVRRVPGELVRPWAAIVEKRAAWQ